MVVKREMERKMHSRAIRENYACRRKDLGFFSLGTVITINRLKGI